MSLFSRPQTTPWDVPSHTFTIGYLSWQPFVHGLPEKLDGAVAVATADVDDAAELADSRDVSTIPHFILLRDGVQVGTTCMSRK